LEAPKSDFFGFWCVLESGENLRFAEVDSVGSKIGKVGDLGDRWSEDGPAQLQPEVDFRAGGEDLGGVPVVTVLVSIQFNTPCTRRVRRIKNR
jgi:hypothetical protein